MRITRLSLTDWRNYETADVAFEPGRQRARRQQRPGQDEPRRGDRLPHHARLAPGLRRRRARARGRRVGGDPRDGLVRGPRGARRGPHQQGRREPGAAEPLGGAAARDHPERLERAVRAGGPRDRAGGALRPAAVRRRAARAADAAARRHGGRLREGAPAAQRAAARQPRDGRHRVARGLGRAARRDRDRAARRPHRAARRARADRRRAVLGGGGRRPAGRDRGAAHDRRGDRTRARPRSGSSRRSPASAGGRSSGASPWSARIATRCCSP